MSPPVSHTSSSQFSSPTLVLSLTSVQTPAALCWLLSSNYLVGSTLTQLRLHSSSSSSSAPASPVNARLPLWHQLLLIYRTSISFSFAPIFFFPWHQLNSSLPWLFGQIGTNTNSALIWLWLHFGRGSILTPRQLSTNSGFDSCLLLNLRPKPVLFPIQKLILKV